MEILNPLGIATICQGLFFSFRSSTTEHLKGRLIRTVHESHQNRRHAQDRFQQRTHRILLRAGGKIRSERKIGKRVRIAMRLRL
jgi:hypothetical protein